MPFNKLPLTDGPCCEINKLIVQIVGTDHPSTQRLAFYQRDTEQRLDAFTAEDVPENIDVWMCAPSQLHVWDWTGDPGHSLMLEVAAEHGPVIRLPLPDVSITTRKLDQQRNQIVPVVPCVPLPGANSAHDYGTPVLCRAGYFYVFLAGRLWRELEVRIADERTTYHDIALENFRVEAGFCDDARAPTGKALEDIWIPANWNDHKQDVQLCFSEVQLAGDRLHYLEHNSQARRQRCQSPDLRVSKETTNQLVRGKPDGFAMLQAFSAPGLDSAQAVSEELTTWRALHQRAFPLSVLAPQRARQPGYEWSLDQPARHLCTITGQFPASARDAAHQHVRAGEQGTQPYRAAVVESSAWAYCLERILEPDEPDDDSLWQAQPTVIDAVLPARKRKLYGVMLSDQQYRLRHLSARIQDQQRLLHLYAERAQRYPHHASALLIQQMLMPTTLGGQDNPLHSALDKLPPQGQLDIDHFTVAGARAQLCRQLETSQALLTACMQQVDTEQTLADHLSLEGFAYVSAFHFVSQLFASLAMRPEQQDPLAINHDGTDTKASSGQQLISNIANDLKHPLHSMLWPDADQQNLESPYTPAPVKELNRGDGRLRLDELASFEDKQVFADTQTTLDSALLASLLESGSLKTMVIGESKAAAAALLSAHETLHGAIDMAEQAMHAAQHVPLAQTGTRTLNEAVQRRNLALLRGLLPATFGAVQLIPLDKARNHEFYVLGLDQKPKKTNRTAYGVFLGEHGRIKSDAELHNFIQHEPTLPPERMVVAIPKNHRTALILRDMNRRFNEAWQTAFAEQSEKKNAIQQAADQVKVARNHWAFRALDSTPFAVAVVGLEMWNLRNELAFFSQTDREKGKYRAYAGSLGAVVDLTIAMEALTVKLAGNQSVLAAGRKIILRIPDAFAKKMLGRFSKRLVTEFSARLIGQMVAGSIFTGLNLYDAWYSHKWNDDASIGYLLMATGGMIGTASLFVTAGSTLLGIGPAGWIALILLGIGIGLVSWLSSTALEDWLANGPFGHDPHDGAAHLQDPEQAFYYLVSLFANIRISRGRNPEYLPQSERAAYDNVPASVRNCDTCIRIESSLPGLLGEWGDVGINAFLRKKIVRGQINVGSGLRQESSSHEDVIPRYRLSPNAMEMFVDTPPSSRRTDFWGVHDLRYAWQIRAQFILNDGQRQWVFPAPPPRDPTPFGPEYARPDFINVGRPYWADKDTDEGEGSA